MSDDIYTHKSVGVLTGSALYYYQSSQFKQATDRRYLRLWRGLSSAVVSRSPPVRFEIENPVLSSYFKVLVISGIRWSDA